MSLHTILGANERSRRVDTGTSVECATDPFGSRSPKNVTGVEIFQADVLTVTRYSRL